MYKPQILSINKRNCFIPFLLFLINSFKTTIVLPINLIDYLYDYINIVYDFDPA